MAFLKTINKLKSKRQSNWKTKWKTPNPIRLCSRVSGLLFSFYSSLLHIGWSVGPSNITIRARIVYHYVLNKCPLPKETKLFYFFILKIISITGIVNPFISLISYVDYIFGKEKFPFPNLHLVSTCYCLFVIFKSRILDPLQLRTANRTRANKHQLPLSSCRPQHQYRVHLRRAKPHIQSISNRASSYQLLPPIRTSSTTRISKTQSVIGFEIQATSKLFPEHLASPETAA